MNNIRNILYALPILLIPVVAFAQDALIIKDTPNCEFSTGKVNMACIPEFIGTIIQVLFGCLLYTSPSPRDATLSRMPSSA